MIWSDHVGWYAQPIIFVLYGGGSYGSFQDSYDPSAAPLNSGATPPLGLLEPVMGFGKVWRQQPGVRDRNGWGKASEASGTGRFEMLTERIYPLDQSDKPDLRICLGSSRQQRACV
jgi:hypothetical protein